MSKPFSQACENNKRYIVECICHYFNNAGTVLEIGSYTAQHAIFFIENIIGICWQTSEIRENMGVLEAGLAGVEQPSLPEPLVLDVRDEDWPLESCNGVFSANTLHIMSLGAVEKFFIGVGKILEAGGYCCIYGPFRYQGQFTTPSNADFDVWLKQNNPASGVRDFETVSQYALKAGLEFIKDYPMPANNQLLVWQKKRPE